MTGVQTCALPICVGLDGEHVWPSGGGDAGVHRLGSARAYVGTQSQVSSSGTDGRLMWTTDTTRLFHVGSGGTRLVGGDTVLSFDSDMGLTRHRWTAQYGEGRTASGTTVITIPNSGFSGIPFIFVTPRITSLVADGGACILWVSGVGNTQFTVNSRLTDGATTSNHSFYWQSLGSRVL